MSSKNSKTRSIEFQKFLPRQENVFLKYPKVTSDTLTTEEDKALRQKVNYPNSFKNDFPRDPKRFLKKRKQHSYYK